MIRDALPGFAGGVRRPVDHPRWSASGVGIDIRRPHPDRFAAFNPANRQPEPMSDSGQFCPRCGAAVEAAPAERRQRATPPGRTRRRLQALCDECYLEAFDLVDAPDRLRVAVCPRCGAVRKGEEWVDVDGRDYTEVAVDTLQDRLAVHVDATDVSWVVDAEQVDPTTVRLQATFTGTVRGVPVEETVTVPVDVARATCDRCGRIAGDYYASVVQVRAADRTPTSEETDRATEIADEVVAGMEATGNREAFVSEVSAVPEGLDIKVSTTKIGQQIANRLVEQFGGSVSSSETLVTEDEDGDAVYRVTYAVRLPRFRPGEVIDTEGGPVLVTSVTGNLKGTRLTTGEPFEADWDVRAERVGSVEDAEETTLVSIEDDHAVQILDPETYEATTVPRPAYLDPEVGTVRVLKSRAGLHILPDD